MKTDPVYGELRIPLLALAIVIATLALTGLALHDEVVQAGRYSQALRVAQNARAHVLRFQLDEETGIRGFSATLDPLFLEPYRKAAQLMDAAFVELEADLEQSSLSQLDEIVERERRENRQWVATVALPLTTLSARSATMLELHRRGKRIVDTFRNDDQRIISALNDAGAAADARSVRLVTNTLLYLLGSLIVTCVAAGGLAVLQARTARRAFEQKALYENEKRIADALQEAFLVKTLPNSRDIGLHATYIPALFEAQIGGDWYDAFELPDERIFFSIGDVAGHGIDAAVIMNRARQSILAVALHENDPAKVLERANETLCLQQAPMVTAICGYIEPRTLEITYATAGHPPPVLSRPAEPSVFLEHDGIALAVIPNAVYRTFTARASHGALFVLYTDGVIEQDHDILSGERALLEAVRLAADQDDPALSITDRLFASTAPRDDVAVLTIRITKLEISAAWATDRADQQVVDSRGPAAGFLKVMLPGRNRTSLLPRRQRAGWRVPVRGTSPWR